MEERLPKGTLGGQAVMEGVMMKGPDSYSIAVRRPDQKIEVKLETYRPAGEKNAFFRLPLIRGVVNFVESVTVGMKTLSYSSAFYEEDEVETKADRLFQNIFKEKAESVILGFTVAVSIMIAAALFMFLPAALAELIGRWVENRILLSIIEGVLRLVIFILYVILISRMEDIRRVFMYHGAEHKTINCYEAGKELTPENVAKYSRYHKRCGTSFIFVVMIISIFVFMFITAEQMWLRFLLRLLLVPVVAGISYEFIRAAGRRENAVLNILSRPGMWVQNLTTREPKEEMIQVAIVSVEAVLYGESYVKAVNEAQGISAAETEADGEAYAREEGRRKKKEKTAHVSGQSGTDMKPDHIVLGDELEDDYENAFSEEGDFMDEETEEEWSAGEQAQPDPKIQRMQDTRKNKSTDTPVERQDLSEFEKSFFED